MPRVIVTRGAREGLERCRRFLSGKNPQAARRAAAVIAEAFARLETAPEIGRPSDPPELRELVIGFGAAGYVALYHYVPGEDTVAVLAFRHQREAGC